MVIQANNGCYLTQVANVPLRDRRFEAQVIIMAREDISKWREITAYERDALLAEKNFIDVDSLDYKALARLEGLNQGVKANINSADLTDAEAVEMLHYFPAWDEQVSSTPALARGIAVMESLPCGYKLQHNGKLYRVIKEHQPQPSVMPGSEAGNEFYNEIII